VRCQQSESHALGLVAVTSFTEVRMRFILALSACLLSAGLSRAEGPSLDPWGTPSLAVFAPCTCDPCTCDPKSCTCPNCEAGCKKQAAQSEQVAFVGSDPFQTAPASVEASQPATQAGYHTEYRKVCNGTSCQMVPVTVRDAGAVDAQSYSAPAFTSCSTGTCGSVGAVSASGSSCSSGSCGNGFMSRGPVRRLFSRGRCR
jgi:hypothetical protein